LENHSIYADIATRTGGDIYIGVVGPVRTGKSTFIKRFMEALVLPNISDPYERERARDEMPQSAAGRTVMTAEPKFIPDEAVKVSLVDNAEMRVKMIDCVGYLIPDAMGSTENGAPRMVMTPWSSEAMPFEQAAELGTQKVISEHSTIGIVVTTDGTIGDLPRKNYVDAEKRVISELKKIGKPFVIILNSANPGSDEAIDLAYKLEEQYKAPVALVNCLELDSEDIRNILEMVLLEFPVKELAVTMPAWTTALDRTHPVAEAIRGVLMEAAEKIRCTGDIQSVANSMAGGEYIERVIVEKIDLGTGCARIDVRVPESLYYRVLSDMTGFDIDNDAKLISLMRELADVKRKYDRVAKALEEVEERGYGIVTPEIGDLKLEEPEIIKQAGGYGVRLKASGPSIHMIKAEIETVVNPIVGTEQQSEDLVKYLLHEFEEEPAKLWESNIFGKTLHELVNEGLLSKLQHMPDDARAKLSETLQRIINEGSGGLICILL